MGVWGWGRSSARAGLAGRRGRKSCQGLFQLSSGNKFKPKTSVYRQGKTHCHGDLKLQSRNLVGFFASAMI